MARTTKESLELLRTSLDDIKTSLTNKEVVVDSLKASEVPEKIREIENEPEIFGYKITEATSNPTTRVKYQDQSSGFSPVTVSFSSGIVNYHSWENSWFFDKIYPAMVKFDGTIDYKLDRNDQTKKENGEPSDINDITYDGNAMVVFEKFYTKFDMDGEDEVIQFSDKPLEGFEAIGFIKEDGTESDRLYCGMFMGSFDEQGRLRSIGNQEITRGESFENYRVAAQKCGKGYDIEVYSQVQVISALLILMFKSCDWQKKIGTGRYYYNNGYYKTTGVLEDKGAIAYDINSKTIKFMWIEDFLTGGDTGSSSTIGLTHLEVGALYNNNEVYVKMKPPYSGNDTSGYEKITDHVHIEQDYISKMKANNKYGRTIVKGNGSSTTYETCREWESSVSGEIYVCCHGTKYGGAGRAFVFKENNKEGSLCTSLSYLPPT